MGKCQSRNFAAQLAATTITALQYIASLAKGSSYETIVESSGCATLCMELSVTERIWGIILEMVKIMTGSSPLKRKRSSMQSLINRIIWLTLSTFMN